jgi:hypothetical protein
MHQSSPAVYFGEYSAPLAIDIINSKDTGNRLDCFRRYDPNSRSSAASALIEKIGHNFNVHSISFNSTAVSNGCMYRHEATHRLLDIPPPFLIS